MERTVEGTQGAVFDKYICLVLQGRARSPSVSSEEDEDVDKRPRDADLSDETPESSASLVEPVRNIVAGSSSDIKGRELEVMCGSFRGVLLPGARRGEESIRLTNVDIGKIVPAAEFVKMAGRKQSRKWSDIVQGTSETGEFCTVGQLLKEQVGNPLICCCNAPPVGSHCFPAQPFGKAPL
jgi:hypothetical protein